MPRFASLHKRLKVAPRVVGSVRVIREMAQNKAAITLASRHCRESIDERRKIRQLLSIRTAHYGEVALIQRLVGGSPTGSARERAFRVFVATSKVIEAAESPQM